MKKLIITYAFMMFVSCIFAQTRFIVDSIKYITTSANTVAVTSGGTYTGSITIPSTVVYSAVNYNVTSIGNNAFFNFSGLISVTIPSSVTSIGSYAFSSCVGLTSITIPNSVTSIGSYAFSSCVGLTSITIPNSVTSIRDFVFSSCSSLTTINVDVNNTNYSSIDGVLFNKDKTTIIYYPGGKQAGYAIPNSVTSIGIDAFYSCTGLTSVTIPASVFSIGNWAFGHCTGLTSITIPSSVTSIGSYTFYACSQLTSITIPSSVTSIGDCAFQACSQLISITIPSSVTLIKSDAFCYCTGLTSVTIPNSVASIESWAFGYCTGLTSITIPSSVSSIGISAFNGCTGLTSITIPSSVSSIGDGAFSGCSKLTSIYAYPTTPLSLSASSVTFKNVNKSTCTLYVPTGSKAAYQTAFGWKDFTHIVEETTAVPTINETNFSLYLNPMDNVISVNGLKGMLRVFDINGRLLLTKQVAGNESVSIGSLPQGLYIVKLITAEGTVERKVLKK